MNAERATHELTFTWTLEASPADVFRAWTDPDHLDWFHNPDFPSPVGPIEVDLRVGGAWRQRMIVNEKITYFTGGVYREIVPNEKLVFAWGADGGWPELDPDHLDASPLVTVTLAHAGGRTDMTVIVELPASMSDETMPAGWFDHIQHGWCDTVDRLAASLANA